jgi:ketosteroid isomerase-like protein
VAPLMLSSAMSGVTTSAANTKLITSFYEAFRKRDAEAMGACYAPGIRFTDPVFGPLEGERARAMWRMLNQQGGGGLQLTYQLGGVDDSSGTATWQAKYKAPTTGRPVENNITSRFWFAEGLIVRQEDAFDLWKWAAMALGPTGRLMGWSPMIKGAIRKRALANLDKFIEAEAAAKD